MIVLSLFNKANEEGRYVLTEFESKEVLKQAGIPVVETRLAKTRQEAARISREVGFQIGRAHV